MARDLSWHRPSFLRPRCELREAGQLVMWTETGPFAILPRAFVAADGRRWTLRSEGYFPRTHRLVEPSGQVAATLRVRASGKGTLTLAGGATFQVAALGLFRRRWAVRDAAGAEVVLARHTAKPIGSVEMSLEAGAVPKDADLVVAACAWLATVQGRRGAVAAIA